MTDWVLAGCAVVAAALLAVIAGEVIGGAEPPMVAHPLRVASAANAPIAVPDRTADEVATLLARPLFSLTRRPPPAAATNGVATAPDAPLPRLAGVLVDGGDRRAIFAGAPKPLVLREGARVGAFTISRIAPGRVALIGPDGTREIRPQFDAMQTVAVARPPAVFSLQSFQQQTAGGIPRLPGDTTPAAPSGPPPVPVPALVGAAPVAAAASPDSAGLDPDR